jgi:hypothetical protein
MSAVTSWHEEQGHPKPNMRGARAVLNAYKDRLAMAAVVHAKIISAAGGASDRGRHRTHRHRMRGDTVESEERHYA